MLLFAIGTRPLLHDPLEQPTSMVSVVSVISINKSYNHTVRLIMFIELIMLVLTNICRLVNLSSQCHYSLHYLQVSCSTGQHQWRPFFL